MVLHLISNMWFININLIARLNYDPHSEKTKLVIGVLRSAYTQSLQYIGLLMTWLISSSEPKAHE